MAKGIIYVMTTVVPGLIKIGKTGSENFESRMYHLERNGYSNVVGLKRAIAIEVSDYDEKEKMLHEIFSKSNVPNTELFALDIDLVIQLLSSFRGKQIYPKDRTQDNIFEESTENITGKVELSFVPEGTYYLERIVKGFGKTAGKAIMKDGKFYVLKGSVCAPITHKGYVPDIRKNANIVNNILQEDILCNSPSYAGWIVIGKSNNGWVEWKDEKGNPINIYRKKK